jgi:hypothetical protein
MKNVPAKKNLPQSSLSSRELGKTLFTALMISVPLIGLVVLLSLATHAY